MFFFICIDNIFSSFSKKNNEACASPTAKASSQSLLPSQPGRWHCARVTVSLARWKAGHAGGRQDMLGRWAAGPSALATTEGHGHSHNSSAVSSTVNFSATVPEPCTLDAVLISETLDVNVSALTVTFYSSRSSTIPAPQPFRAAIPKLLPNTWAAPIPIKSESP